ncbi:unnamed protein product, partial [marine sediment metagenome]
MKGWFTLILSAFIDITIYTLSLCKLNPLPKMMIGNCIMYNNEYDTYFFVRGGSDDIYSIWPHRELDVHDFILDSLNEGDIFVD